MNKQILDQIKSFGMTNHMLHEDLQHIGKIHGIELMPDGNTAAVAESAYYPQFSASVRAEAENMAGYYAVFYSLETSIRALVYQVLEEAEKSAAWWESVRVPATLRADVSQRIQRELDSGVTRRSDDALDYTTFGELSLLISSNWDVFGSLFNSKKAVEKVMTSLNAIRNPIAHCSPLAEDEQIRLQLTVRDWFRLME